MDKNFYSSNGEFAYAFATHEGRVKENNEDTVFIDPATNLFVVCDGMGGHDDGAVASAVAAEVVGREVKNVSLEMSIHRAHQAIAEAVESGQGNVGMGTTVLACQLSKQGHYEIAWVGDSRAYSISQDTKNYAQITEDHSYVNYLLKSGYITPHEVAFHPYKNLLLQAVGGAREDIEVSVMHGRMEPGSFLLLCSDGLSNEIEIDGMVDYIRQNSREKDLQKSVQTLVEKALDNGGKDNISVILVYRKPSEHS